MLPSRGLRPHQFAHLASRQPLSVRTGVRRQFSSVPRKTALSTFPGRTSPLQPTNWRAGAALRPNVQLSASLWTWGSSSTPSDSPSSFAAAHSTPTSTATHEPVITSATPEMAPAGIDKAATVDGSHTSADAKSVEELLGLDPAAPVDTTPVLDIHAPITYWGQMKDLGLDYGWGSSAFFENLVELSYLNLEMGWVGSIALSALAIRSIIFFGFQVRGSDSMAKLGAMKPIMQPLNDEMEVAKRMGDDQRVQVLKMKQQSIMKEVGADIINNLGTPLAGMVFGFGAFRCLRGMTELPLPGMSTEKFLWINDLTVSDPLFLMPVLTSGMMYAVIKGGGETGMNNATTQTSMQKNVGIAIPIVMGVITCFQPAAVQIYFFISTLLASITSKSLQNPAIRRFLRIRALPTAESNALASRVIQGKVKLDAIPSPSRQVRYQAPRASTPSSPSPSTSKPSSSKPRKPIQNIGTIKRGLRVPAHMTHIPRIPAKNNKKKPGVRIPNLGVPKGGVGVKWEWLKSTIRNKLTSDQRDPGVIAREKKRVRAQEAVRKYELEKKKRFEN